MAALIGKSKDDAKGDTRAARFRRMRLLATGLLVVMFAVFVATLVLEKRWGWGGLGYVRAFAEAAMVGAIADWFAVVALFRRPFGLPIPHTAIIPRNKDRIGESLGNFICNNFLAPDLVAAKLESWDAGGRLSQWLSRPETAHALARRAAAWAPALLDALDDESLRAFARNALGRGIRSVEAGPLAARVLSVLVAHGHHQALFDKGVAAAGDFLRANEDLIRAKVSDRSWRWLPRWVDEKLADKVMTGLEETLAELRDPFHPWRIEFQRGVESYAARLAEDPGLRNRAEMVKAELLANPLVEDYLDSLWAETRARLAADLVLDESVLRQGMERAIAALAARLAEDSHMRAVLNRWLRRAVDRAVVPYRGEIGAFISGVVARWDARTLVDKLEIQVGKDLQYIRINGALVGGLVGLAIFSMTRLLG